MESRKIREAFAKYFINNGHQKIASSSLIPHNDQTLLFANAGMNQFKDYFTGKEKAPYKRAVTIQKCVRAGGKHNDLENVGLTTRHHTFFEMLGNFSFGDYFKKEAIEYAWEFLTKTLSIPGEKLFVTVHHSDDEAFNIWNKNIKVPADKIFRKGDKDNFWEMGEFGPCGPCSEIFYDYGPAHATPNFKPVNGLQIIDDETRYVEIWNLVFMQFEKNKDGQFPLPKPSIDTGSGFERLSTAMQGKYWNYDTDLFSPIIKELENISEKAYADKRFTTHMRIVADHIRASTMLITDGVMPSNEGRGYVLRRIIRRAIRSMRELQAPPESFYKLAPIVLKIMGSEYPENANQLELAQKLLQIEESRFLETLDQGYRFLEDAMKRDVKNNVLNGESAFKLYDTYGFPIDLTQVILREKNIQVDLSGFEKAMSARKEDSKKSWKGHQNFDNEVFFSLKNKFGESTYVGYEHFTADAKLLSMVEVGDGVKALLFDKTPFYAESGGQVGDTGEIYFQNKKICTVFDTQCPVEKLYIHFSKDVQNLTVGNTCTLKVDAHKRGLTAKNHSATHLLQAALIKVLGAHVNQAGSLVNPEKLRFDFTHFKAVSNEELREVETMVNHQIQQGLEVNARVMPKDEAMKAGAMALFGEKYGSMVRVLKMGNFSTELCGGCHVDNTSNIGYFKILSESSLSSGIRRIEAQTSTTAIERLEHRSRLLEELEALTASKEDNAVKKILQNFDALKESQKDIQTLKDKLVGLQSKETVQKIEKVGKFDYLMTEVPEGSDLRKLSDSFISQKEEIVVLLYSFEGEKMNVLLRLKSSGTTLSCGKILKEALNSIGGNGGGKPDMAQGSGDRAKASSFLENINSELRKTMSITP